MKQFQLFFTITVLLFAFNLLISNDWMVLWSGGEVNSILNSRTQPTLPGHFLQQLRDIQDGNAPFFWRLPSALIIILGLVGFYQLAKLLFGKTVMQYSIMTLAASFLVVNYGKLASQDSWAFSFQSLSWILMLLSIKQASLKWQVPLLLSSAVAVWIQPLESSIFLLLNAIFLQLLMPGKRNLFRHYMILPAVGLTILILYSGQGPDWSGSNSYWTIGSSGHLKFIAFSLLAWGLFLGFVLGGIREIMDKLGKKEELSIILVSGLIAALLANAIVLHIVLAVLAGRQLKNYFDKKYPYESIVKTGAVLHLVFAFAIATVFMIYSFVEFRGPGFRSALALTMLYWMGAFISVIGLYGKNQRYVIIGTVFGGVLSTLIYYVQPAQVLETRRAPIVELLNQQEKQYPQADILYTNLDGEMLRKATIYSQTELKAITTDSTAVRPFLQKTSTAKDSLLKEEEVFKTWSDDFESFFLRLE